MRDEIMLGGPEGKVVLLGASGMAELPSFAAIAGAGESYLYCSKKLSTISHDIVSGS